MIATRASSCFSPNPSSTDRPSEPCGSTPAGSVRSRSRDSVELPEWLKATPRSEANRLGISEGRIGRLVKHLLFKAYFQYCALAGIEWMVIAARSPLDRQYDALLFNDCSADSSCRCVTAETSLTGLGLQVSSARTGGRVEAPAVRLHDSHHPSRHRVGDLRVRSRCPGGRDLARSWREPLSGHGERCGRRSRPIAWRTRARTPGGDGHRCRAASRSTPRAVESHTVLDARGRSSGDLRAVPALIGVARRGDKRSGTSWRCRRCRERATASAAVDCR